MSSILYKGNVPFCPRIPNDQAIPPMLPGHNKQAQTIMIEQVHAVILHSGCYTSAGARPFGQEIASIWVSQDYGKKGFAGTIRW
jgi:hypothetical protein